MTEGRSRVAMGDEADPGARSEEEKAEGRGGSGGSKGSSRGGLTVDSGHGGNSSSSGGNGTSTDSGSSSDAVHHTLVSLKSFCALLGAAFVMAGFLTL